MSCRHFLLACVALCVHLSASFAQGGTPVRKSPLTRFTCVGRTSGYYADLELGCRVYHMCDGLGRQFSYTCPNMTLFQQRMLICDHWYMVNCSMSERDYSANLLIGQRDKPFVSDDDMRLRTPRPDILAAPPYNPYFDILREEETKYAVHPGNSIVGVADTISGDNNGLDSAKKNYRPPTSWSTGKSKRRQNTEANFGPSTDNLQEAASQEPEPTFRPPPSDNPSANSNTVNITPPSRDLSPPLAPTTTEEPTTPDDTDLHVTASKDPVFNFIKRFDPNSPDSHKTAMSKTEILDLNEHLPQGQVSSEEDRTPRKNKNFGNSANDFKTDSKSSPEQSRFDTVNTKSSPSNEDENANKIPEPERVLLPPKINSSPIASTTVGPPIYYEWKWAVPAIDLEPPKISNSTNTTVPQKQRPAGTTGTNPFSTVTRKPELEPELKTSNTEYNISSYYIPDYVFPLDNPHPGYENDEAMTSFQVQVARPGRASYGENPKCPQCHPAYLEPGTCEPCIVKR